MYGPQDMYAYMNWTDTQPEKCQSSKRWLRGQKMYKQLECRAAIIQSGYSVDAGEKVPCDWGNSPMLPCQLSFLKVQLKWQLWNEAFHTRNNLLSVWLNFIDNTFIIAQHIHCTGVVYMFVFPFAWIHQEQGLVYSKY